MRLTHRLALFACLTCACGFAQAESVAACAKIERDAERLACFDRVARAAGEASADRAEEPVARPVEEAPRPSRARVEQAVVPASPTKPAEPTNAETGAAEPAAAPITETQIDRFGRRPPREKRTGVPRTITATVSGTRKIWPDNRIAYTLDNGQTWTQTHTQIATIFAGDAVTITKSRFGGYFLRGEGGAQVKVKRTDKQK